MLKQRGYRRKLYGTQEAALKALATSRIDYAYLWENTAWLAHTSPELAVEVVQPYALEEWRNMAAALRRGDEDFKTHLDAGFMALVEDKFIEGLLSRDEVPYYPPDEVLAKEALQRSSKKPSQCSSER